MNISCLDSWLLPNLGASRWCVAFSGGPDSTVLLDLIHRWCAAHDGETPELVALHLNHKLQLESDDWQLHCETICKGMGLEFIAVSAELQSTGQGLEAAARKARYSFFEKELGQADILFMGHHLDDQVETYFLRLLRGAGLSGLSAMPAQRALGSGQLIRPLLQFPRAELQQYLKLHRLRSIDDPSNADTTIDRNFLRQQVLPLLEQRWGGYRHTVARAAEHAAMSQQVIQECLPAPKTVYSALGDPGVALRELNRVSSQAAMIKLRQWLQCGAYPMPVQPLLAEFIRQLREGASSSRPRLDCGNYVLQRYQEAVYLLPGFSSQESSLKRSSVSLALGEALDVEGVGRLSLEPAQGAGLRLGEEDTLEIRWRKGGETCRPQGRPYNQRLKKLLQEFAVPPWWRERVPLLYLGDELLAVGSLWLCESSRYYSEASADIPLWQLCWGRKPAAFD